MCIAAQTAMPHPDCCATPCLPTLFATVVVACAPQEMPVYDGGGWRVAPGSAQATNSVVESFQFNLQTHILSSSAKAKWPIGEIHQSKIRK